MKKKPTAKRVTKQAAEQLPAVSELYFGQTGCKPISYDWQANPYIEKWEYYAASKCEKCGEIVVGRGGENHCDIDQDSECDGYIPSNDGPMMSYYYPLDVRDSFDPREAAKLLVHLPLVIVEFQEGEMSPTGDYALALSGGGMDLSWEICEAFMRLGYLPPVHFSDLPQMAGRGASAKDRWIIAACRRSLQGEKQSVGRTLRRLRENFGTVKA